MTKLILFDIDGTLVLDDGAAKDAFGDGLRDVYGFEKGLDGFDFSGKTDPQIAHEILEQAGWERNAVAASLPQLWFRYLEGLRRRLDRKRQRVLPGVVALLERLQSIEGPTIGLLTGNIEPGARIKLTPWGLNRHFEFGAFGSDSMDRTKLPPIAAARAEERTGKAFRERDLVIIGDSIWDVRCGVPHDATTIAVASGHTSADRLKAENPTFFFESMEETERWVRAIIDH